MASYSTDSQGILEFRDENNRLLFSRVNGVSVPGWSSHPHIVGKFKNVDESSGSAKTKDK